MRLIGAIIFNKLRLYHAQNCDSLIGHKSHGQTEVEGVARTAMSNLT
jgi:hypothetical protein